MALYQKWTNERGVHASWTDITKLTPLTLLTKMANMAQPGMNQRERRRNVMRRAA
jgi:hypothetical protein